MRMSCSLILCLAVILNSIESSSQSEHFPVGGHHIATPPQPDQPAARSRSRSPTLSQTSNRLLGFRSEDLAFIRLRPHCNPDWVFELRRFVFPPDKPIRLRRSNLSQCLMPTEEQIVLSTSHGDVCAILDENSNKNSILRPILTLGPGSQNRAKINMYSGEVTAMTENEIADCPVSSRESVKKNYAISRSISQSEQSPDGGHHSASSQQPAEQTVRSRPRSSTLEQTFTGVLGFRIEDLAFIRLRPHINPDRVFELRRYVFPPDKPIRLRKSNLGQSSMPTEEQIVLSTSDGDVCAILDKKSNKNTIIRAICTLAPGRKNRAKINMISGEVTAMTAEEVEECPVSTHEPVAKLYGVFRSRSASTYCSPPSSSTPASSSDPTEPPNCEGSKTLTLRQTFPNVLGYDFDYLAFIRLSPHNYRHRIFELRIYAFPPDKPIGLRTNNRIFKLMPTGDQIVLATSNDDVCAILLRLDSKHTSLRPIWASILGIVKRVKINMRSGVVEGLTTEEIAECPAVSGEAITRSYVVFHV